jgi:hypothetical protein
LKRTRSSSYCIGPIDFDLQRSIHTWSRWHRVNHILGPFDYSRRAASCHSFHTSQGERAARSQVARTPDFQIVRQLPRCPCSILRTLPASEIDSSNSGLAPLYFLIPNSATRYTLHHPVTVFTSSHSSASTPAILRHSSASASPAAHCTGSTEPS